MRPALVQQRTDVTLTMPRPRPVATLSAVRPRLAARPAETAAARAAAGAAAPAPLAARRGAPAPPPPSWPTAAQAEPPAPAQQTLISSQHTQTNPMRSAGARLLLLDPSHRVVSSGDLSEPLRRERLGSSCCSSAVGGAVTGAVTNVAQPRVLVPKRRQPPRAVPVTVPLDPGVGCRPACVEQGRVGL